MPNRGVRDCQRRGDIAGAILNGYTWGMKPLRVDLPADVALGLLLYVRDDGADDDAPPPMRLRCALSALRSVEYERFRSAAERDAARYVRQMIADAWRATEAEYTAGRYLRRLMQVIGVAPRACEGATAQAVAVVYDYPPGGPGFRAEVRDGALYVYPLAPDADPVAWVRASATIRDGDIQAVRAFKAWIDEGAR